MGKQVLNQASEWYSYGFVLLVMFVAVAGAAIRDLRLANAAAKAKAKKSRIHEQSGLRMGRRGRSPRVGRVPNRAHHRCTSHLGIDVLYAVTTPAASQPTRSPRRPQL